jgi:hypothetical protein
MHQHDTDCAHGPAAGTPTIPAQQSAPSYDPPPGWQPAEPPSETRAYRILSAMWTKPSWLAPLAILGCIGAAFGYVLANDPSDQQRDPLGPCAFKLLTGLDCPGCGGTRMVWFLLHGNLGQAARHHLVAFIAVPVLAYAYVAWALKRGFNVTIPTKRIPGIVVGGYFAVWLAFSVLRNLPWEPFSYFFVT